MGTQSILLTHPLGAPFVSNAIQAFEEQGVLSNVVSTLNITERFIKKIPFARLRCELSRRSWIPDKVLSKCTLYPSREVLRILLERTKFARLIGLSPRDLRDDLFVHFDKKIAENLPRFNGVSSVYAYEDSAAATFERAKSLGIRRIYDLPIAYYKEAQRIQREEAELFPHFSGSFEAISEPQWKQERKRSEAELADLIVVPSRFVQESLINNGIDRDKILVVPFGAPNYFRQREVIPDNFHALFVGRIGPRKGVHYLLDAWAKLKLKNAKLTLVGINEFPDRYLSKFSENIEILPSMPHRQLEEIYHSSSVLVLPSLVEGFALVLLEAMACGIPVIATKNSAAEDLISEGKDGFVIDVRSVEHLMQKLEWMYENKEQVSQMGRSAFDKARQFSWSNYRLGLQRGVCQNHD